MRYIATALLSISCLLTVAACGDPPADCRTAGCPKGWSCDELPAIAPGYYSCQAPKAPKLTMEVRSALSLMSLIEGTACADEHEHSCKAIGPPVMSGCCKLREKGKCVLKGKAQCTPQGCDCGATCEPSCGGCI